MFVSSQMISVDVVKVAVHRGVHVAGGVRIRRHSDRARDVIRTKLTLDHGPTLEVRKPYEQLS